VKGVARQLAGQELASAIGSNDEILLETVSEIDAVALLAGVERAEAAIDLLNADYSRLKASSAAVDFQEFLGKINIADIVKNADWEKEWKTRVRIIDETENMTPEARELLVKELSLLRGKVLTEIEKNLARLASRKYMVVQGHGVTLRNPSKQGSKVTRTVTQGGIITATGMREKDGVTWLLFDRLWASTTGANGKVVLEAVSLIYPDALLAAVVRAEGLIELLSSDCARLKAENRATVDFEEFLEGIHLTDIVRNAVQQMKQNTAKYLLE
jgi:hypothetical protein